ncbi:MAG: hypothetical protein J5367_05525 [Lachnospiraceae bacterium]|nr:hypothetical protein [Lachnospiraceae bacterium]
MKIVIAGVMTLATIVLLNIPVLKKKKGVILALYAVGMILFFVVYNFRTIHRMIRFYYPKSQTLYQAGFFDVKEYPDAFLEEFLKGKNVYTPDDAYEVVDDVDDRYDSYENYWLYYYYHARNMWSYLELNGAKVIRDDTLNGFIIPDEQKTHFEDLGPANDMLRYTFPLTDFKGEWGNAFYYYWFYSGFVGNSRIYICAEDLKDETDLVLIWQDEGGHDTECYYLSSKKFFDGVIRPSSHVDAE